MFLDIDGNKVFALSFGSAPRTILAHSGWIGNVEDWIATLAPLSATWRTAVYDHRGTGETVVPVEKITPEALIDDVFRVMDALAIDRCVLAGFSRGVVTRSPGSVARTRALRRPHTRQRLRRRSTTRNDAASKNGSVYLAGPHLSRSSQMVHRTVHTRAGGRAHPALGREHTLARDAGSGRQDLSDGT